MKDIAIVMIILAIVFGGSFLSGKYFQDSGSEVLDSLQSMADGLETDSEEEKNNKISILKEKWDEKQKVWIMFQYHENINAMEDIVIECCNYYKTTNKEQFNISHEKLKRSIEDLKNREDISILNVM